MFFAVQIIRVAKFMSHKASVCSERWRGFTLVELLVVIAIIGILIGMLLSAVQQVREAAGRVSCANQIRQMTLALHNYELGHREFPLGQAHSGTPIISRRGWSTYILPFLERNNTFNALDLSSNIWTSPNLDTIRIIYPGALCPSDDQSSTIY